ncbi:MAG: glycosyltransferase [Xanthobacteraceae bacterium]
MRSRRLPDFLARMYGLPPETGSHPPQMSDCEIAPELDCLRDYLAPELLQAATERSRLIGTGADRVLIQWGVLDEDSYLQHLAAHTGVRIDAPSDTLRSTIPLHSEQFSCVAQHGLLPLLRDGEYLLGIAPRILTARWLSRFAIRSPDIIKRLRLLPAPQLNQALMTRAYASLAYAASEGLSRRFPGLTAAPSASRNRPPWRFRLRHAGFVAAAAGLLMLPAFTLLHIASSLLAIWFLAFSATRIIGALVPQPSITPLPHPQDDELPVYTIIAALYREAASVRQLLQAIAALDYPKEKLDVILVVEPDDRETRAAIAEWGPQPTFQVLVAPATLPRTKPKALNWALPFARGSFVTIFDAEDIPEPNQLRAALDAFRTHGARTVCVQASLCINNPADSWLSCMFAAEYAGQFDVFLPGLATLGLPLPLGGSSNHFRTATLREIGGWDAYNVTEDADLGFRLARSGYRASTFTSTTFEEAPVCFDGWLRQRSRWMKGWMQTWGVHMRAPRRLWREVGAKGVLSLNLLIGGNVLTALAAPILLLELAAYLWLRAATDQPTALFTGPLMELHMAAIVAGYASTAIVGVMGLARRGQLRRSWVLLLTPIYWALLSVAAWRALYQLFKEPYRWEKPSMA